MPSDPRFAFLSKLNNAQWLWVENNLNLDEEERIKEEKAKIWSLGMILEPERTEIAMEIDKQVLEEGYYDPEEKIRKVYQEQEDRIRAMGGKIREDKETTQRIKEMTRKREEKRLDTIEVLNDFVESPQEKVVPGKQYTKPTLIGRQEKEMKGFLQKKKEEQEIRNK